MAVPPASSADEATALALSSDCIALACGDPDPAPWGVSGWPLPAGTEQPAWNSSNALSAATVIASAASLLGIPSPRTSGPARSASPCPQPRSLHAQRVPGFQH